MLELVLIRHAKTLPPGVDGDDHARELAPVGRTDAPRIGAELARRGVAPDVMLVSDARRCRETWQLLAPSLDIGETRFESDLYLAPAEVLLQAAESESVASVALIAHNPGLHDLGCALLAGDEPAADALRAKFPPGSAARFTRAKASSSWRLSDFILARDLRP